MILTGLTEPAGPGDVPGTPPGAVTLGTGKLGIGSREVGSPTGGMGGKGRSGVGKPVGIETPLSTAEIDPRSTELVSVGRGGNAVVGSPAVGISLPGRVGVGTPALGIEAPGSDGSPVGAPTLGAEAPGSEGNAVAGALGIDAPGTDVRTRGVGLTPPVGSEAAGRVASVGLTGGRTGGKGTAGEAETWKTYAPSDIRMIWSIVENPPVDKFRTGTIIYQKMRPENLLFTRPKWNDNERDLSTYSICRVLISCPGCSSIPFVISAFAFLVIQARCKVKKLVVRAHLRHQCGRRPAIHLNGGGVNLRDRLARS